MRTSEVLEKAAEEIERCGWTQGGDGGAERHGAACCVGIAIARVTSRSAESQAAEAALMKFLGINDPIIFIWNDAPDRTAAEVIAALRAAAAQARTSESP